MSKASRSIVVLVATTLCVVPLAGRSVGPTLQAQAQKAEMNEHPHPDACVLVEAFVVEVKLSELYKQGVSPIGRKPNSASVESILKCLDAEDMAEVTTGLKVAVHPKLNASARTTETMHMEREAPGPSGRKAPGSLRYVDYDIGKTLRATASVLANGRILVGFDFSESTYRITAASSDTPPNAVQREWSGAANLEPGRPCIAGATQNESIAAFLILCADVEGR